jgi:hypothetical protein
MSEPPRARWDGTRQGRIITAANDGQSSRDTAHPVHPAAPPRLPPLSAGPGTRYRGAPTFRLVNLLGLPRFDAGSVPSRASHPLGSACPSLTREDGA